MAAHVAGLLGSLTGASISNATGIDLRVYPNILCDISPHNHIITTQGHIMAYEAYKATVNHIAETAYIQWQTGASVDQLITQLAAECNVERHHCMSALTQLINKAHTDRLLTR